MKLRDLKEPNDYLQLPHLLRDRVRILWHSRFYDVPIDGLLMYNGEKYWFKTTEDIETNENAEVIYLVIGLSEEQMREVEQKHEMFRQLVGEHTDYDEYGARKVGELKPRESRDLFYSIYSSRPGLDLSNNTVIGWI